jgi:UDP-N-acetylglucosamine 2-epimerase (non-hydrolysing)
MHPNPVVRRAASVLHGHDRIHLLEPLAYEEFIMLLRHAWIVVTDSGGIQEEAPSLGKRVLLFRAKTERMEAVDAGVVFMAATAAEMRCLLEGMKAVPNGERVFVNPFGDGGSAKRIVDIVCELVEEVGNEAPGTVLP